MDIFRAAMLAALLFMTAAPAAQAQGGTSVDGPRIVNIVNFIRGVEPREPIDLLEPVVRQIELVNRHHLPATFLIQYDAMQQDRFVKLLKEQLSPQCEIGGWFEVVQPMAEAAGLPWRGRYPWDWHTNVGFPVGYTPEEREKLVDVFMQLYQATFEQLPKSVGSWFLDAHTLAYMADTYGVEASCNCKDQFGTDGYTLWGGYWNQAYYPSRLNALMPAQSVAAQIPVPVFRMLGSDPIYQYDMSLGEAAQSVVTLEPVYKGGGGNPAWVRWFFNMMCSGPCLAFAYAQAGQENSFGWPKMANGLLDQAALLEELSRQGKLRVETLAASAAWFKKQFPVTPATAVTALEDWKNEGRKTIWFDSRYYRANLFWQGSEMRIRDIHLFDECYAERYLKSAVTTTWCEYDTLPVLDSFRWSRKDCLAGIRPVAVAADGTRTPLAGGAPTARAPYLGELLVEWPLTSGGTLAILLKESAMEFRFPAGVSGALECSWCPEQQVPVTGVEERLVTYRYNGFDYRLGLSAGRAERTGDAPLILFIPKDGQLAFDLGTRPRT